MPDMKYIALIFLLNIQSVFSFAQLPKEPTLPTKDLRDFTQAYSCAVSRQEHIFISVNSGIYYPGESVIFKALLLGNDLKIKTDGSRFFYLQLVDYTGKSINNYTFELHNGECSGNFNIPATLQTGIYEIKAYTRWMLNFGADNFFRRPVMIISPLESTVMSSEMTDSVPVKFYPQCGKFISNVNNKVLVRTNPRQQPLIKKINISDEIGNIVDTCLIDQNGLGVFSLNPDPGHLYYASIIGSINQIRPLPLPPQINNSYIIYPERHENHLNITIIAGPMQEETDNLQLVLLSESTGNIINQPVVMNKRQGQVSIPLTTITGGLHQILLLRGHSTILSQCTWYKKDSPAKDLLISVNDTLNTRSLANARISVLTPSQHQKVSASIINEFNPVTDSLLYDEYSYLQYFSLYSCLSNAENMPVFSPDATEDYINNSLIAFLNTRTTDFLLRAENKILYLQEIKGLSLSGKVVALTSHQPLNNAAVLLTYPDSIAHFDYTYTNEKGEFNFVLNDKLYGKQVYVIVQDHSPGFNPVEIIINDPFSSNYPEKKAFKLTHPAIDLFATAHQSISLAHRAFYQDKNIQPVLYRKDQPYTENFYGKPDFSLIPAEFESLPNIYEIRKNLIPGIKFEVDYDIFKTYIFDPYLQLYFSGPAFVLLNNIPFPSLKNMLELNSDNIRNIDLKRNKFFYDNYLMFGIIAIYTKTPMVIESSYNYKTITTPSIVEPSAINEVIGEKTNLPDIRHTLSWRTNQYLSEGKAEIPFKTPDIKGSYRVRVIYLTTNGTVAYAEKPFFIF
jgi:hypothetical protein